LGPTTNQEEYSICIPLSAVGSQASGQLSTFCGDYEEVCVLGGFIAEDVNGAGHKGSVQITHNKIMGSLVILHVTDSKPSDLGTISFNCQSIRFFWSRCFWSIGVLPYYFLQYPLEHIPSAEIKSLAEFVCAFML
jgi:hypothetical protein